MVALNNTAEGGTLAAAVTTGNSGGSSGDAWDSVGIGGTGTITFDNTQVNSGARSYKVVGDVTNNTVLTWEASLGTVGEIWGRIYLYITATPLSALSCIWVRNGANNVTRIRVNTSGKIEVTDGSNSVILTSTNSVATGQWVRIEYHCIALATNGTVEMRLYNTAASTTPTETLTSTTASLMTDLTRVSYGRIATTNPPTLWLDDLNVNTTGWPGPVSASISVSDAGALTETKTTDATAAAADSATGTELAGSVGGDGTDVEEYLSGVATAAEVTLTTSAGTQAGWWLVAIQSKTNRDQVPLQPTGTAGKWTRLAEADGGFNMSKISVDVRRVTVAGAQTVTMTPSNGDNIMHVYVLSGTRPHLQPSRVFMATALASSTAGTSRTARSVYSPDDSGLLICAWTLGDSDDSPTNLTLPGALTARAEVDGSTLTSRTGEQGLTVYGGTGARTATASAGRVYTAASIVVRPDSGPITWPGRPMRKRLELALGVDPGADPDTWADAWVPITVYTLARDPVTITRGRGDESTSVDACKVTATLNNRGGRFTRLNPTGPYYGLLSKNTPFRPWINLGDGWELRATAAISEWPPRSAAKNKDEHMQIRADGILRRLRQESSKAPLRSVLRRALTSLADQQPVAYWPCEDASEATSLASALPGGRPMLISGSPTLANSSVFACSDALPTVASSRWTGIVPPYTATGRNQVRFLVAFPSGGLTNNSVLARVTTSGSIGRWDVVYTTAGGGSVDLRGYDSGGSLLFTSSTASGMNGLRWRISVELVQDGGNVDWWIWTSEAGQPTASSGLGTEVGTVGLVTSVVVDPTLNVVDAVMGHVAVHNVITPIGDLTDELAAYVGETAAARFARLCREEGVPVTIFGDPAASEPMGAQGSGALLDLLAEVELTDGGLQYETREGRLGYQTRADRYNAAAALQLDYAAGHIPEAAPLEPTDDDQLTRNDVELTRKGGSSARAVDQESIDTFGRAEIAETINVQTDDVLPEHAAWWVHRGTVQDLRYSQIAPNLMLRPELVTDWLGLDIGQRLTVDHPPPDLPPGTIDTFVEGYTETYGLIEIRATANTSPGSVWNVGVLDDPARGVLDSGVSELAAGVDADDVALSVAIADGLLWSTDPADYPLDITIGGEDMTVTAVSGTASPQTFTVIRSANGVQKSHLAGAGVHVTHPLVLAL